MEFKPTDRRPDAPVEAVRELVENRSLATTQDGLPDMAIHDPVMAARHAVDARLFAGSREDVELRTETEWLERDFGPLDAESWPD